MRKRVLGAWIGAEALESRVLLSASKAGPAAELVFSKQPATGGQLGTITVAVEDAQGRIVKTDSSKIALAIESGPSGASITGTAVVFAKKGIATFNAAALTPPGTYTLIATDGSLSPAVSQAFTIKSAATRLVIVAQPKAVVAGAAETVKFALESPSSVVQTGDSSNVTLTINSGPKGGKLSGTFTVAAVNGVASFTGVVLPKAGTYTLKATSGTLKSAATSAFTVSAGAAVFLKIVSVTNTTGSPVQNTTGAVGPVVVDVVDAEGNVVTTDESTVTLVLNTTIDTEPVVGTVTQNQTATATAVNGVATFNALASASAGYYSLFVTDSGFGGGASQLLFVR